MRSALDGPGRKGKIGEAVQSLNLRLFVNAEDCGTVGRIQVEADDACSCSISSGSVESLKLSLR